MEINGGKRRVNGNEWKVHRNEWKMHGNEWKVNGNKWKGNGNEWKGMERLGSDGGLTEGWDILLSQWNRVTEVRIGRMGF